MSIFSWGTNDLRLMFAIASSKTTILAEAVIAGDDYLGHDDYYSGDDDNYNEDHNNNYNKNYLHLPFLNLTQLVL